MGPSTDPALVAAGVGLAWLDDEFLADRRALRARERTAFGGRNDMNDGDVALGVRLSGAAAAGADAELLDEDGRRISGNSTGEGHIYWLEHPDLERAREVRVTLYRSLPMPVR